ncbi:MAG: NrdJb, partial [Pseudomonadota bacterium]
VIGLIKDEPEDPAQAAMLAEKRAEIEAKDAAAAAQAAPSDDGENYPESATLCSKCNTKAMVVMDNCETCLACGYSKCG